MKLCLTFCVLLVTLYMLAVFNIYLLYFFSQLISNALIKRASLRMQQANDTECFADFEAAISLDDSNADTYHHRGQVGSRISYNNNIWHITA